jgi:hypothetical protein
MFVQNMIYERFSSYSKILRSEMDTTMVEYC